MFDRDTLRARADEGDRALDRLADLADARDDLAELSDLLDEGCEYAGKLLTRRAVAAQDLRAMQRLSDADAKTPDSSWTGCSPSRFLHRRCRRGRAAVLPSAIRRARPDGMRRVPRARLHRPR